MSGVDPSVMTHKLSTFRDARPVAQKKRKLGEEKRAAAREEIEKLLQAKFVREAHYTTWLANIVLVKKSNGKWRMCTDYTDLNKACPKDSYPLSSIDRLVDGAAGHKYMSFLDAFSGYNQISMHPPDINKTAFMTDDTNYVYEVMPFGLKKRWDNLPEAHGQNIQGADRPECRDICGRHDRQVLLMRPTC